jgi:hypothetical protein
MHNKQLYGVKHCFFQTSEGMNFLLHTHVSGKRVMHSSGGVCISQHRCVAGKQTVLARRTLHGDNAGKSVGRVPWRPNGASLLSLFLSALNKTFVTAIAAAAR